MSLLKPYKYVKKVSDISLNMLVLWDVKAILLDTDNTLAPRDSEFFSSETREWIDKAKKIFGMCIVSNGRPGRVRRASQIFDIPYVYPPFKPFPGTFRKAASLLGVKTADCVMIGDQVFTDVLGGNLAGMKTILVDPVDSQSDGFWTKLLRRIERRLGVRG